ncbi:hypothetical protein FQN54_007773 [Arachnomyces sp. PD_36]|nr:hypothetical protein FQN54_007773 [Arachnomyces sp. PD_36]
MSAAWSESTLSDGDRYRSPVGDGPTDGSKAPLDRHEKSKMANTVGGVGAGGGGASGRSDDLSASQKMISATWGSILTSLLVTPLDVVRVRLQSQTPGINPSRFTSNANAFKELPPNIGVTSCCREVFWVGDNAQFCIVGQNGAPTLSHSPSALAADCAAEETQRKTFTSTLDGLRKISRHEGALSLWRGLSPTLVMAIPANVIYFTGYDWMRLNQKSPIKQYVRDAYAPLVAGGVARIAAASVISPIEMFRTRLQATSGVGTDHFKATLRGLHQMTQAQGYSSLWRGLTLTMWRDVPFSGLYWWGYETVRNVITDTRQRYHHTHLPASVEEPDYLSRRAAQIQQDHTTTFVDAFVAGATSGAISALVTTPFDVGKTRQQVVRHLSEETSSLSSVPASTLTSTSKTLSESIHPPTPTPASIPSSTVRPEQLSIPRFLMYIFREEGVSGLFRGWAARCLKVAPACAIMISSYEIGKKMARDVNERKEG